MNTTAPTTNPPSVAQPAPPKRAIAVLPFTNLSPTDSDEYLALGVAESLLHRLAEMPELLVIARTSSSLSDEEDPRSIARFLLVGGVQRSGERLRVTAHLMDAATRVHVWSLKLDRTMDDIFAVQDEISRSVALAVQERLGGVQPLEGTADAGSERLH